MYIPKVEVQIFLAESRTSMKDAMQIAQAQYSDWIASNEGSVVVMRHSHAHSQRASEHQLGYTFSLQVEYALTEDAYSKVGKGMGFGFAGE
jgi:hypothetical protein